MVENFGSKKVLQLVFVSLHWLGEHLIIPSFVTHYDQEIFENPSIYQYDLSITTPKVYKNGKLVTRPELAFGGGTSYCPGRYFARNEIKVWNVFHLV